MIAALIRWTDGGIKRNILAPIQPWIGVLGVGFAKLLNWHPLAVAAGALWATFWIGLWVWRVLVWAHREDARQRRPSKRAPRRAEAKTKPEA